MGRGRGRAPAAKKRAPPPLDLPGRVGRAALAIALFGTALVVDSRADNAFDAPKRFLALVAIAAAAVAVFGWRFGTDPATLPWKKGGPRLPVLALYLLLFAIGAAFLSALVSPRRTIAFDALRAVLIYALLLPLGASRAAERPQRLLAAFLAATAINAAVSLLQASGAYTPFAIRAWGGREATGAFAGNVGYLAIALAFAALAALGVALHAKGPLRLFCAGAAVLFVAALLVNQNLTALTALAAGSAFLLAARFGRRSWIPLLVLLACLASAAILYRPLRVRAGEVFSAVRVGDWDRVLTYRAGPWLAAVEMARDRPMTGVGPGAFGPEFVPHRLEAEIRARRRFVNPLVTSSYAEAHSDYLQPFAEIGILGGAAAVASAGLLLVSLVGALRRMEGQRRAEAVILAAILIAGATAALTWFPMQRPITALPLLLAAGRGWRLAAEGLS